MNCFSFDLQRLLFRTSCLFSINRRGDLIARRAVGAHPVSFHQPPSEPRARLGNASRLLKYRIKAQVYLLSHQKSWWGTRAATCCVQKALCALEPGLEAPARSHHQARDLLAGELVPQEGNGLILPSVGETCPIWKHCRNSIQLNTLEKWRKMTIWKKNPSKNESPCNLQPCTVEIKQEPDMKGLLRRKKQEGFSTPIFTSFSLFNISLATALLQRYLLPSVRLPDIRVHKIMSWQ